MEFVTDQQVMDMLDRTASYVLFSGREYIDLRALNLIIPDTIGSDEDKMKILFNDPTQRFMVKDGDGEVEYCIGLKTVSDAEREMIVEVDEWKVSTIRTYNMILHGSVLYRDEIYSLNT